jgi:hypothetical protein
MIFRADLAKRYFNTIGQVDQLFGIFKLFGLFKQGFFLAGQSQTGIFRRFDKITNWYKIRPV